MTKINDTPLFTVIRSKISAFPKIYIASRCEPRRNDLNTKEEPRKKRRLHRQRMREPLFSLHDTYVHFRYSRPRYETKTKENPILHCHGQYHRKDTFTLHRHRERIALNGTTTRMAPSARARRLVDSRTHTAHSLRDRVSPLSWSNRLRYYRVPRDSRRSRRAALVKQQRALSLEYMKGDRTEEKRRDREKEDCEASRRWSALDLASVRSLAGPSCSPVLICFLLPSRLPTVPLRRSLPRSSPPCSGKGGFRSPPVS